MVEAYSEWSCDNNIYNIYSSLPTTWLVSVLYMVTTKLMRTHQRTCYINSHRSCDDTIITYCIDQVEHISFVFHPVQYQEDTDNQPHTVGYITLDQIHCMWTRCTTCWNTRCLLGSLHNTQTNSTVWVNYPLIRTTTCSHSSAVL